MLERWQTQWNWLFYVLLAGSTSFAAVDVEGPERRAALVALAAGLAVWYWRAVVPAGTATLGAGRGALPSLAVAVALWAPLLLLHPLFQLLLFNAYHLVCSTPAPLRRAVPPIAAVSALVVATDSVRQDSFDPLQLVFYGVVTVALGFLVAMTYTIQEQSEERRRLITELEATRGELAVAERKAGALAERQRLAGDIHDTLAQGFASIVTLYEAARAEFASRPEETLRRLEEVGESARANLAEARRVVWALRPGALEGGSLDSALGDLVDDFRSDTNIDARSTVDGDGRGLGPETEAVLLRVAQEALANVRKHASADRVAVTLTYLDDTVMLDVRDDGVGFDPDSPLGDRHGSQQRDGGFGLTGMRERVEQHGGTLTIESAAGAGTAIVAALPTVSAEPANHQAGPHTPNGKDGPAR